MIRNNRNYITLLHVLDIPTQLCFN